MQCPLPRLHQWEAMMIISNLSPPPWCWLLLHVIVILVVNQGTSGPSPPSPSPVPLPYMPWHGTRHGHTRTCKVPCWDMLIQCRAISIVIVTIITNAATMTPTIPAAAIHLYSLSNDAKISIALSMGDGNDANMTLIIIFLTSPMLPLTTLLLLPVITITSTLTSTLASQKCRS